MFSIFKSIIKIFEWFFFIDNIILSLICIYSSSFRFCIHWIFMLLIGNCIGSNSIQRIRYRTTSRMTVTMPDYCLPVFIRNSCFPISFWFSNFFTWKINVCLLVIFLLI